MKYASRHLGLFIYDYVNMHSGQLHHCVWTVSLIRVNFAWTKWRIGYAYTLLTCHGSDPRNKSARQVGGHLSYKWLVDNHMLVLGLLVCSMSHLTMVYEPVTESTYIIWVHIVILQQLLWYAVWRDSPHNITHALNAHANSDLCPRVRGNQELARRQYR